MRRFYPFHWGCVFSRWASTRIAPVKLLFSTAAAFSVSPSVNGPHPSPVAIHVPPVLTNIQLQLDASVAVLGQLLLEYEMQISTLTNLEQSNDALIKLLNEFPGNTEFADQLLRLRAVWQECSARCIVLQSCLDIASLSLEKSLDVAVIVGPHFAAKPVLEELAMCDRVASYSHMLQTTLTELKQKHASLVKAWNLQVAQDIRQVNSTLKED